VKRVFLSEEENGWGESFFPGINTSFKKYLVIVLS